MRSGFFNSEITGYDSQNMPVYDRAEEASFFAKYFNQFIGNGVYNNPSTSMQVVADSDMTIKVSVGTCYINGYFGWVETDESLEIEETESLSRIDRVVARLSLEDDDRKIYLDVLQGEESTSPTAPELTRSDSVYEIALADISVGLTTVEITDDLITDLRWDTDLCGAVELLTVEDKLDADSSDYIKSISGSNSIVTMTHGDDSTSTTTVKGLPSPYSGGSYQEGIYCTTSTISTLNTTTYLYEGIYMMRVSAETTTGIPPLGDEDSEFTGNIYLKTSSTYPALNSGNAKYIRQDIYYPNPDYDEHYKRTVTYASSSSITYGDWEKVVETQDDVEILTDNIVYKDDFAILTGTFTISSGSTNGSLTLDYPTDYTKTNCVPIAVACGKSSSSAYQFGFSAMASDWTTGSGLNRVSLGSDSITLRTNNISQDLITGNAAGTAGYSEDTEMFYKLVLFKYE